MFLLIRKDNTPEEANEHPLVSPDSEAEDSVAKPVKPCDQSPLHNDDEP